MSKAAPPPLAAADETIGFERIGLGPGSMLRLHLQQPDARHYHVQFIGMVKDKGFITSLPVSGDKGLWMTPGGTYVFHVLAGMYVHAFTSQVLIARAQPYPHVHFEYPAQVQSRRVRKAPRVRMSLDARLSGADGAEQVARVVDLSLNGALVEFSAPVEGDSLRLTLPIQLDEARKELLLSTVIRNRATPTQPGQPWHVGVEFGEIPEQDALLLHYFICHASTKPGALGS